MRDTSLFHYLVTGRTMDTDTPAHVGLELFKASPPAGAIVLNFMGIAIADWVSIFMSIYAIGLCVQMFYRFGKWLKARREGKGD